MNCRSTHIKKTEAPIPSNNNQCPTACSATISSICTYNGDCYRTFANECHVNAENCRLSPPENKYTIIVSGTCESQPSFINNICHYPIDCTFFDVEVCGFNGCCYQTFKNICFLNSSNCYSKFESILFCKEPASGDNCPEVCTTLYDPVCTYNGDCYRTFGNECEVDAENCRNRPGAHKYKIVSEGECENEPCYSDNICHCAIDCIAIYEPVCGYNGFCYKTFSNNCNLDSYNCWNPYDYFVYQHDGECNTCENPVCIEE
ncbi:U-Kazal-Dg21.2-like [Condylostylus longicornis]|uniref:U-Kazal-Dg21.2-like n=1 Tax=Condylostylus longicornis TaxID=2530218 RepID=UPI00244DC310|nr:U-Kazal-Dg21.2-like [Condylostylus longicornis]